MAKLTKATVKERLAEIAVVEKKLKLAGDAQDAEMEPFLERYNEDTKPVIAKFEKKMRPLLEKRDELLEGLYGFLEQQEADISIESNGWVAERKTQKKLLPRVIDVKKFIEAAKKKGEAMYACITIGVKKAEDLMGSEIDNISTRPEKTEVTKAVRPV